MGTLKGRYPSGNGAWWRRVDDDNDDDNELALFRFYYGMARRESCFENHERHGMRQGVTGLLHGMEAFQF